MKQPELNLARKIGLTGGIGSGKSSVAEMLAGLLGCKRIDADEVCRQLFEPHKEGWLEFTRVFGSQYQTEDGSLDRPSLRNDLFGDEELRRRVNDVIHPLAKREILRRMAEIVQADPESRILVEVPLLYEVGWEKLFDIVVVVFADRKTCLDRLMERDGLDRETAEKELRSQLDLSKKTLMADYVIDNSGPLIKTNSQVERLAELLQGKNRT